MIAMLEMLSFEKLKYKAIFTLLAWWLYLFDEATNRLYLNLKTRGFSLRANDGSPMKLVLVSLFCMMVIDSPNKTISSTDQSVDITLCDDTRV